MIRKKSKNRIILRYNNIRKIYHYFYYFLFCNPNHFLSQISIIEIASNFINKLEEFNDLRILYTLLLDILIDDRQ